MRSTPSEYDTTVGGVALENVVDVFIGELEHELDPTLLDEIRHENDALVTSGCAFVYAVTRVLGVDLRDVNQATIGGVLIERLGRVPEPGDVVEVDGLRLEVAGVQDGRVKEVHIGRAPANGSPAGH